MPDRKDSPLKRLRHFLVGAALDPSKPAAFRAFSLMAFLAWAGLGSDGLSSSAYGPEEIHAFLGSHAPLAAGIALATAATVGILCAGYMRIIEAFPAGGGGYLAASKLLSPLAGMVCGCALIMDYILTIAVSAAAAADSLFSLLPGEWQAHKAEAACMGLLVLIVLNLRGYGGPGPVLIPVFLIFLGTQVFAIAHALASHGLHPGALAADALGEARGIRADAGAWGALALVLGAYAMGAAGYGGIEAISDGMTGLREPRAKTAKRTMAYLMVSLAFLLGGLLLAYQLSGIEREPGRTMNASLFRAAAADWPRAVSDAFVSAALICQALILFGACQVGFQAGPRVLAGMAADRWLPTRFANLSDRLVTQNGIFIMGLAALAVLIHARASVAYLAIPYGIAVFLAIVLTQAAMVRHWSAVRRRAGRWLNGALINGSALALSALILAGAVFLGFHRGGGTALAALGFLAVLALLTRRRYRKVADMLVRLESLVKAAGAARAQAERGEALPLVPSVSGAPIRADRDPKAKTAVLVVGGYDGLGLHSLFAILRLFGNLFRNFVFVEVGLLDAGNYKGMDEVGNLQAHVDEGLSRYVGFMRSHGYHAEAVSVLSHDAVEGAASVAPRIVDRYPQAIFFMGQMVFPEETLFTRLLHNNLVFSLQRRLYHMGIPFIILPVRIRTDA